MKLRIKAFNDRAKELYENHSHFHSGDAGLDLFVVEDQTKNFSFLPDSLKLMAQSNQKTNAVLLML